MAANFSRNKQNDQSGTSFDLNNADSHTAIKQGTVENPKEWEKQIWFWRSHLDIFIHDFFSTPERAIDLFDFQAVIARQAGNCKDLKDVEARSLGKTYKMAWILSSICILFSECPCLVVSKTVKQACLTLKYIKTLSERYPALQNELKNPVRITKDGGIAEFKNGSTIEAMAMNPDGSNLRGFRKKIILIDESAWVKSEVIQSVLMPILKFKRDIWWAKKDEGFEDFDSKLFEISSAYLKSCDFFQRFRDNLNEMKKGDTNKFASALNYKVAVRCGTLDEKDVLDEKEKMPLSNWEMEYNSRFLGSANGALLPYDITEPCRDLERVELFQPKGSKSVYVLSMDVATSAASWADNSALTIVKISEKADHTYHKYLVYIRTFHGYKLEALAIEIRKMGIRFPNISKILIDGQAIGEGLISLLNTPYVDDTGKEHPSFVPDDCDYINDKVIPIIRVIKADNRMNGRMATMTKLYFENRSLHLPVQSSSMRREQEGDDLEEVDKKQRARVSKAELLEELGIYTDTDALQYECGNIVPRITSANNTTYDTALTTQHKDRYSSLAMCMEYISQLEEENKKKYNNNSTNQCWGRASKF
ncbi:hypothetical protein [Clostridium estertheticum]|uniref:hypothetical protein n=1 Tax=Clostridium estertheticum TaxID=238834 RepID=UPI001C0D685C|nr:hypothetical protein [Clostridium estertheticum]MBU3186644.1 hypothetical protein [Clostridium estertheticum]